MVCRGPPSAEGLPVDSWVSAELKLYDEPKPGGHRVVRGAPTRAVILSGVRELEKRFGAVTLEEDEADPGSDEGSPYVLVAIGVKLTWEPPPSLKHMRFWILPVSPEVAGVNVDPTALFITCMPGKEHGTADGFLHSRLGSWIDDNRLGDLVDQSNSSSHAAGSHEPDTRLDPANQAPGGADNDGGVPFSRLIIEVEYKHRGAGDLMKIGHMCMSNHYTRVFIGIKVWKKHSVTRRFGAVAAVWIKDAVTNAVQLHEAFDFGTEPVGKPTLVAWAAQRGAGHLPPVQTFTRLPAPVAQVAAAVPFGGGPAPAPQWPMGVPASAALFEVYDATGTLLVPPAGAEWVIDSYAYQQRLNKFLL